MLAACSPIKKFPVDQPEAPLAGVGRVDAVLRFFSEKREDIEVGVTLGVDVERVRLRIPAAARCRAELDLRIILLRPLLDVCGGLDLDPDAVFGDQIERIPFGPDAVGRNAERLGDDELGEHTPRGVHQQVRKGPTPEVENRRVEPGHRFGAVEFRGLNYRKMWHFLLSGQWSDTIQDSGYSTLKID